MKFEFKTENENYSKSLSYFFGIFFILTLIIILCDLAIKLGIVSRHYEIDYYCKRLSVEKSTIKSKKLSRLTNLNSKQRIWEFCREIIIFLFQFN